MFEEFRAFLSIDWLSIAGFSLLRILTIFVLALAAVRALQRSVPLVRDRIVEVMKRHRPGEALHQLEKRAATLGGMLRKTLAIVIWSLAVVMILRELKFDIGPILAGAGVIGLAVGFGAQNLVRDVISGLFMLVENQISVNDVVIINGTGGLVEEINLRTTVLRSQDGTVHIFPNGGINTLSNMTHEFSYYVFDIAVAYKEDTDRVIRLIQSVAEEVRATPEYGPLILEPLDVLGVDGFADSAVMIKARIKTLPIKQWQVGREMNRRIKMRFDSEGIEIPLPRRSIHFAEGMPARLQMDSSTREELRQIVRDVLAESRLGTQRAATAGQ